MFECKNGHLEVPFTRVKKVSTASIVVGHCSECVKLRSESCSLQASDASNAYASMSSWSFDRSSNPCPSSRASSCTGSRKAAAWLSRSESDLNFAGRVPHSMGRLNRRVYRGIAETQRLQAYERLLSITLGIATLYGTCIYTSLHR